MAAQKMTEGFPEFYLHSEDGHETADYESARNWATDYGDEDLITLRIETEYLYPNSSDPEKPYSHTRYEVANFTEEQFEEYTALLSKAESELLSNRGDAIRTVEEGPDRTVVQKLSDYS